MPCQKAERLSGSLKVHSTAAATTHGLDCADMREQLDDENMRPILKKCWLEDIPSGSIMLSVASSTRVTEIGGIP